MSWLGRWSSLSISGQAAISPWSVYNRIVKISGCYADILLVYHHPFFVCFLMAVKSSFFLQTFIPCKVMRFSFEFDLKIIFVPQLFAIEPGETWERWNILWSETWEVLDWSHLSVNQSPRGMAMKESRTVFFRTAGRDIGGVLKFRWEWKILLFFCMAFCWQFETRVAQGWRSRWLRFQRQVWSLSIAFYFGDIRAFRMAYRAVCVSSAHAGENFNSTGSFVLGFIMRECLMNVKSPLCSKCLL